MIAVQIGDIVELPRDGGGRWVVAAFLGGPNGDFAKLVRKRSDGSYTSFIRPAEGLVPEHYLPFEEGEKVNLNTIPETGTFITMADGMADVLLPTYRKELEGGGTIIARGEATARVSLWSLVLENRLPMGGP